MSTLTFHKIPTGETFLSRDETPRPQFGQVTPTGPFRKVTEMHSPGQADWNCICLRTGSLCWLSEHHEIEVVKVAITVEQ